MGISTYRDTIRRMQAVGVPPARPALRWVVIPSKKKGWGQGDHPPPPLSANGSFSARLKPSFRMGSLAGNPENVRVRSDHEEGGCCTCTIERARGDAVPDSKRTQRSDYQRESLMALHVNTDAA